MKGGGGGVEEAAQDSVLIHQMALRHRSALPSFGRGCPPLPKGVTFPVSPLCSVKAEPQVLRSGVQDFLGASGCFSSWVVAVVIPCLKDTQTS